MNGVKLCYEIKKRALGVPCIIYTGRRSEEIVTEAFSVGVDDFVRKEEELGHYKVLARKIRTPWMRGALMVDTARAH